jgi:hypothetical protein
MWSRQFDTHFTYPFVDAANNCTSKPAVQKRLTAQARREIVPAWHSYPAAIPKRIAP